MTLMLVAVGGAAGATLRYLVDHWLRTLLAARLPWATLLVNLVGSFLLGLLAGAALLDAPSSLGALAGIGFCGALTTYSTFGYDTVRLFSDGARLVAVANVLATTTLGLACGALGLWLAGSSPG